MLALLVGFLGMIGCQSDTVVTPADSSRVLTVNRILIIGNKVTKDRKSTRLNSSHVEISYAVFCLKKKKKKIKLASEYCISTSLIIQRREFMVTVYLFQAEITMAIVINEYYAHKLVVWNRARNDKN